MVRQVLEDWRSAPVSTELRAALGFIEALTMRPSEVDAGDIAPLRAAGLSDTDIQDVAAVCAAFNIIVRIADTLDFEVPSEAELERLAPKMAQRRYR